MEPRKKKDSKSPFNADDETDEENILPDASDFFQAYDPEMQEPLTEEQINQVYQELIARNEAIATPDPMQEQLAQEKKTANETINSASKLKQLLKNKSLDIDSLPFNEQLEMLRAAFGTKNLEVIAEVVTPNLERKIKTELSLEAQYEILVQAVASERLKATELFIHPELISYIKSDNTRLNDFLKLHLSASLRRTLSAPQVNIVPQRTPISSQPFVLPDIQNVPTNPAEESMARLDRFFNQSRSRNNPIDLTETSIKKSRSAEDASIYAEENKVVKKTRSADESMERLNKLLQQQSRKTSDNKESKEEELDPKQNPKRTR